MHCALSMKKIVLNQLSLFLTALSFLSRLPAARLSSFLLAPSKTKLAHENLSNNSHCEQADGANLPEKGETKAPQGSKTQNLEQSNYSKQNQQFEQAPTQPSKQTWQEQELEEAQINLGKSVLHFPLVGIFLASLAVLPLWAGLGGSNFWLQAWLYVLFMAWLSRGLHWDGLADLADACASFSQGEKFWKIIKDSSLGALGALVLIFTLIGYIIVVQGLIAKGQWLSLIWAAALGRVACLALAAQASAYRGAALAKIFDYAKPKRWAICWALFLFGLGIFFISWKACGLAIILTGEFIFYLAQLAKKQGGYNGDFLGAAIVLAELITLIAFLLLS